MTPLNINAEAHLASVHQCDHALFPGHIAAATPRAVQRALLAGGQSKMSASHGMRASSYSIQIDFDIPLDEGPYQAAPANDHLRPVLGRGSNFQPFVGGNQSMDSEFLLHFGLNRAWLTHWFGLFICGRSWIWAARAHKYHYPRQKQTCVH